MTTKIAELTIGIATEGAAKAKADLDGVGKSAGKVGGESAKGLEGFAASAKAAFTGVAASATLAVGALVAAGAAVFSFVNTQTAAMDTIAKGSKKLAISTDDYQKLGQIAEHTGTSFDAVGGGIKKLNAQLLEASTGGARAFTDGLSEIGLSAESLQGLDTVDQIGLIGDALNGVADESERSARAAAIFGESAGPEMANLLAAGSEGIREMSDNAGGLFTREDIARAEDFQDSLTDVKHSIDGFKGDAADALAPMIGEIMDGMREWANANREGIDTITTLVGDALEPLLAIVKLSLAPVKLMVETSLAFYEAIVWVTNGLVDLTGKAVEATGEWEWVQSIGEAFDVVSESIRGVISAIGDFLLSWAPIRKLALDLGIIEGDGGSLSGGASFEDARARKQEQVETKAATAKNESDKRKGAQYRGAESAAQDKAAAARADALINQNKARTTPLTNAERQQITAQLGADQAARVFDELDAVVASKKKKGGGGKGKPDAKPVEAHFGDYRDVLATFAGKDGEDSRKALDSLVKGTMPAEHKPETSINITNNTTNNVDVGGITVSEAGSARDTAKAVADELRATYKRVAQATPNMMVR